LQTTNLQNLSLDNLTDKERKAALSILSAVDYDFYVEYVHRGIYQHGAHTKYLASRLQELERGKIKRLMVFMPPRHSKSMTISETFPSWFLGRNPSKKVIVTSYGEGLARRFGRSNRKKIQEFGSDIFGIRLDPESTVVTKWNIDHHNGQMISTGIGGPISGEGADLLIIDDPIKNRQEADSPRYREMIWDEWQNTLLTRLQPGGLVIIVLTRWHEDDLAGRLLQEEPEKWEVISLPALAEENDLLGRDQNEPLWPEYGFDYNWAIDRKKSVGSFVWAALFQQRPAPSGGGIFKEHWWKFWQYPGQNLPPVTMKDENGKPIEIEKKETLKTHGLIEELMLLANKEVAQKFEEKPFLFRIHEEPDEDTIKELKGYLAGMGYDVKLGNKVTSQELNRLIEKIEGKPVEFLVGNVILRSMSKAYYGTKNKGHFGLAFDKYTHFTSPIRRYADLTVHRIIKKKLKGRKLKSVDKYESIAASVSESELRALEAERESIAYKKCEYMLKKIGDKRKAVISGITEWGIYVRDLDSYAEGMISLRSLDDDYYVLDKENYRLIGRNTKKKFALGDEVKVRVEKVDLEARIIDFILV